MIDRRLAVLRAVERHGTVTATTEACRLTPSAVSHQMQALARELDVALLEHVGRRVRLTPAAHALLEHAARLDAQWERAGAELAAHRERPVGGTLRISGFSTAAAVVVPRALELLRRREPALRLQARESEPARSFDRLAAGETDIVVVVATPQVPPRTDPAFEQRTLFAEPLDVLVGGAHRLASRETMGLDEVAADPWIVGSPERAYHQLVSLACTTAGFAPAVAHYADEWDSGAALVARGFGVALIPRLADLPARHDVRRIPLSGPALPTRQVIVGVRAGSRENPRIAAGLRALDEVCAEVSLVAPGTLPA